MPLVDRAGAASDWPVAHAESLALFQRARNLMPGGVQGQGRTCEPYPLYMTRAQGSRMTDVDGNEYIDFHSSFGAVLLGHNDPRLRAVIQHTIDEHGLAFSAAHPFESELAERIIRVVPSAERAVFSCTGSEATYHAIRAARAHTGRQLILKFEGNYHGWHDYVQWSVHFDPPNAGPAGAPVPVCESAGMLDGTERSLVISQYNDTERLRQVVEQHGDDLAAVIVEPVYHNGGVIRAEPGFLEECRSLCTASGAVLIFDEIITGFRHGTGGAQEKLGITPDLTTLGKAIANGMPISVVAGREDVMSNYAPLGPTFFSGTFYGHVLNVATANACIRILEEEPPYDHLDVLGEQLRRGIQNAIDETEVEAQIQQLGSIWSLYFTRAPIRNYRDIAAFASAKDHPLHVAYQRWMLRHGVYIHPHFFIRGYLTAAHTEADVEHLVGATRGFFIEHREQLRKHT